MRRMRGHDALRMVAKHRVVESFLASEMIVDGSQVGTCERHDVADLAAREALFDKNAACRVEQALLGIGRRGLHGKKRGRSVTAVLNNSINQRPDGQAGYRTTNTGAQKPALSVRPTSVLALTAWSWLFPQTCTNCPARTTLTDVTAPLLHEAPPPGEAPTANKHAVVH